MSVLDDLFRGVVVLSFIALAQHGCSVKKMAGAAVKAHQKGLSSYQECLRGIVSYLKSLLVWSQKMPWISSEFQGISLYLFRGPSS